MNEYKELRKKVEETLGFPPTIRRHFDQLAEAVSNATKEPISSTTLRRFWGYQETGHQNAVRRFTLDLLSRYAGYKDYDDFLTDIADDEKPAPEATEADGKKKKRLLLASVIASMVVLGSVAIYACISSRPKLNNYDFEQDSICYRLLPGNTNEVEVTYKSSEESNEELDVTIPEMVEYNGKTYIVTAIGDSAFFGKHGLIAIVLPPTIKRIGNHAFHDCKKLSHLNMPDAVVSVGEYALRYCDYLNSVRLSDNLTEIPPYCFSSCKNLQSIELPEGIKTLSRDAFGDCFKLKQINLPEGLQTIDRGVFWNCRKMTKITLPSTLETIGDFVFWGCDSLKIINALPAKPIRITNIFKRIKTAPKLRVPAESLDAYTNAQYWNNLQITSLPE